MAQSPTAKRVAELIKGPVENAGYMLWDVRFVKEGASWYLRVFIDKDGGIGIDDCTDVSHLIDPIIDEADPISSNYYLEVSSPGIERRLKTEAHFRRYIGSVIDISLYKAVNGSKLITGILKKYENNEITVEADGEDILLSLSSVSKANLHFDF